MKSASTVSFSFVWASLVLFLCLNNLVVQVQSICVHDCGGHGSCVEDECKCDPGYGGPDCSMHYSICPDGDNVCYNGATCELNGELTEGGKESYMCDCSDAFYKSVFDGITCQDDKDILYCHASPNTKGLPEAKPDIVPQLPDDTVNGTTTTTTTTTTTIETKTPEAVANEYGLSFCVNGGTCMQYIDTSSGTPQQHVGCDCPKEYFGDYCQFLRGFEPPKHSRMPMIATVLASVLLLALILIAVAVIAYKFQSQNLTNKALACELAEFQLGNSSYEDHPTEDDDVDHHDPIMHNDTTATDTTKTTNRDGDSRGDNDSGNQDETPFQII